MTSNADGAVSRTSQDCVHRWRIESPNGQHSAGVCQQCGATRDFANSSEAVLWERSSAIGGDTSRAAFRSSRLEEQTLADET